MEATKSMKKIILALALVLTVVGVAACSAAGNAGNTEEGPACVLPIQGDFCIKQDIRDTTSLSIPILYDKNNLIGKDLEESFAYAITFNHSGDMTGSLKAIHHVKWDKKRDRRATGNVEGVFLNVDLPFLNDTSSDVELNSIQIRTNQNSYDFDLGSIHIRVPEPDTYKSGSCWLSLDSHLAGTAGAGLKRYGVDYTNVTNHPVDITRIDAGVFSQYPFTATINGEKLPDVGQFRVTLQPGETAEIVLDFENPTTPYAMFLLNPRISVEYQGEISMVFSPYTTNGGSWTAAELKSLYESAITA